MRKARDPNERELVYLVVNVLKSITELVAQGRNKLAVSIPCDFVLATKSTTYTL